MKSITLKAHFDGKRICPDEPLDIEPNTEVLVTVTPLTGENRERVDWIQISRSKLAAAYAEDEPDYPLSLIKEPNPQYEGR